MTPAPRYRPLTPEEERSLREQCGIGSDEPASDVIVAPDGTLTVYVFGPEIDPDDPETW
jgi:hypothetical protein